MKDQSPLIQKDWSEAELSAAGFNYYKRRKRIVLARRLPAEEAPLQINYNDDELIATAGYMICFQAGWRKRKTLYDYFHWPVASDHFADMYVDWDEPDWKPKRGEAHLLSLGCKPYLNVMDVWAKKLREPQVILGVEHDKPFAVPAGAWLLLGAKGTAKGAPYWCADKGFRQRFYID